MRVNLVCRNWHDERVLPRFTRHLMNAHGWSVGAKCDPNTDLNYLVAYFELDKNKGFRETPLVAYMTHREADGTAKARLYDRVASVVDLRVAMNEGQLPHLRQFGPSVVLPLPLELERFTIADKPQHTRPRVGVSGYTYRSGRKGGDMVKRLMSDEQSLDIVASGRGWPCPTKMYDWAQMPAYFQSLDVFLCTSLIEGGPMTTLEAMATGTPVVIPRDVGIHNQLPDVPGVYKYERGNYKDMRRALTECLDNLSKHNPQTIRKATHPHSVQRWTEGNRKAFEHMLYDKPGFGELPDWHGRAGVYIVAFGGPARIIARECVDSIHDNMPGVPVAICSDKRLGNEDVFVQRDDADIGGRIAKLKVWDNAPQQWQYVLYLDADIEVVADVSVLFDWLQAGFEFIICKEPKLHDRIMHLERRNNKAEQAETEQSVSAHGLAINGGVWAFRRNRRTKAFFERWYAEWDKYRGRDQSALIRALYADPLRVLWLCNEFNTIQTMKGKWYPPGPDGSAGIHHFVGKARRWEGQVPAGKGLTDKEAWDMVNQFYGKYGKRGKFG